MYTWIMIAEIIVVILTIRMVIIPRIVSRWRRRKRQEATKVITE